MIVMMTVWCCCLVIPILKTKNKETHSANCSVRADANTHFHQAKAETLCLTKKSGFFHHVQPNAYISVVKQVLKLHTSFYKIHCKENYIFCGFPALYASHHHGLLHPLNACDTELWAIQRQMQCHSCNSTHKLEKKGGKATHCHPTVSGTTWKRHRSIVYLKKKSGRRGQRFSVARMKIHEWELERREGELEIAEKKIPIIYREVTQSDIHNRKLFFETKYSERNCKF